MTPDEEMEIRADERRRMIRELREWTRGARGVTMYVEDLITRLKGRR